MLQAGAGVASMKIRVSLDDLPEVPEENLLPLRAKEWTLVLLDSSALLRIAKGEVPDPIAGTVEAGAGAEAGKEKGVEKGKEEEKERGALICICDFIKREAINYENHEMKSRERRVRRYLREAEHSGTWRYAEVSTPFIMRSADERDSFLYMLPKKVRRLLLDEYRDLSGTDKCLLIVAMYLLEQGFHVGILTFDGKMERAWKELLELRSKPQDDA